MCPPPQFRPIFEFSSLCGLFCRNICHPAERNSAERHFTIETRPPSGKPCGNGNIPSDLDARAPESPSEFPYNGGRPSACHSALGDQRG